MKTLVCIVCPKGCSLSVTADTPAPDIAGAGCERGREYGQAELRHPVRMVSSTVRIRGAALRRCPVKTGTAIPKALVREAVLLLNKVELTAPVAMGDVVLPDILGTGVDFIATRSMPIVNKSAP